MVRLDRNLLQMSLGEAIRIEAETVAEFGADYSHEIWRSRHFMADRPGKWDLSTGAFVAGALRGFQIASLDGEDTHLHRIAIDRRCRRAVVAMMLLERMDLLAVGVGSPRLTLSVRVSNVRGQRLFLRAGYSFMTETELTTYAKRTGRNVQGETVVSSGHQYRLMCKTP